MSLSEVQASRHALLFIFITMLVDTIGLGVIIPVIPTIIIALKGGTIGQAAPYGGWLFDTYAIMQFLCAPLLGNLSDRYGRRPVLVISLVALSIDYTITGLAPTLAWLFLGRFLSGAAGATYSTANAYIADVSPLEKRAANFGFTGAAFGLGFIIGPALGGFLGEFGPRIPFFVSAGLALANALYGFVVLKESLPRENRRKFELRRANPIGSLFALRQFPMIFGLIGVFILMRFAHDANPSIWTYYGMYKFHWSSGQVGLSLMAAGLATSAVYGFLPRLAVPKLGEERAIYLGLLCGATGFMGYAFATQGWMMFGWIAVWSLLGLATPTLTAVMSRMVGPSEQGALQGTLASLGSLTSIAAMPSMAYIFAWFTSAKAPVTFPGAAFLTAAFCLVAAAVLFTRVRPQPALSPAE